MKLACILWVAHRIHHGIRMASGGGGGVEGLLKLVKTAEYTYFKLLVPDVG